MIRDTFSHIRKGSRVKNPTKGTLRTRNEPVVALSIPVEKGFFFYSDIGEPTGAYATSMPDFLDQLRKADLKSVQFHSERNDFSKWLREVVNDGYLADSFDNISAEQLTGEATRGRLVELTEKRCRELVDVQDTHVKRT